MPEPPTSHPADSSQPNHRLSRREFARSAALAATTAVVAPAALLSQEPATAPRQASVPPSGSGLSPELLAEGELKYQWIIERYGSRLSEAEKKDVHRLVMEGQRPLATLRAFPLENSDQPALVLKFDDALLGVGPGRAALADETEEGSGK